jgi:hypothetical protein
MKKKYEKPTIASEDVYETLAAGCTFFDNTDPSCNPDTNPNPGTANLNS